MDLSLSIFGNYYQVELWVILVAIIVVMAEFCFIAWVLRYLEHKKKQSSHE